MTMATSTGIVERNWRGTSKKKLGVKSPRPSAMASRLVPPTKKALWRKFSAYSGLQYSALPMATMWTISTSL